MDNSTKVALDPPATHSICTHSESHPPKIDVPAKEIYRHQKYPTFFFKKIVEVAVCAFPDLATNVLSLLAFVLQAMAMDMAMAMAMAMTMAMASKPPKTPRDKKGPRNTRICIKITINKHSHAF